MNINAFVANTWKVGEFDKDWSMGTLCLLHAEQRALHMCKLSEFKHNVHTSHFLNEVLDSCVLINCVFKKI